MLKETSANFNYTFLLKGILLIQYITRSFYFRVELFIVCDVLTLTRILQQNFSEIHKVDNVGILVHLLMEKQNQKWVQFETILMQICICHSSLN